MKHKCPICSKVFDTLDSFDTHIENHKNESILNETPRDNSIDYPIHNEIHHVNHEKFFDEEKFQELVDKKINSIENLDELIYRQNFVTILTDVYRKNPFCYLPYFIQFFMNGMTVQQMISKFHFSNTMSYYDIVKKILDLKQKRFENQYCSNALELNLKIPNWSKIFESITDNSKFFEDELNELYFNSVIQARIFLFLTLHHEYISKNELIIFCNIEKENLKSFGFIDESLEKKFQKYFEDGFEKKIDDILSDFIFKRFVTKIGINEKKFKGTLSINDIKSTIQQKLKIHDSKLSFGRLKTLVSEKHPGLNLIPGLEIFGIALDEMKRENIVNLEVKSNWKNDYYVFLNEEFQKISSEIKSLDSKNIPFKGRKINPDQFISELLELEKGDFDDADDQVTRMAGLVLAESVKLQSPHEEILDFDFTVDLQNYAFRPEQIEAIGKLDFRPHDGREFGILHVKVMIDEKLSFKKYLELKNKIPANEQGTIITFQAVSDQIKNDMKNDATIQIIDEEGVRIWVSITPQIPARKNSISKITSDPLSGLENKIVHVNSVFYEKGIALVNVFPDMAEKTVLARTLEEIPLSVSGANNFNESASEYSDFLTVLFTTSKYDDVIDGIFKNKFDHVMKNSFFKFEFDYNVVELNFEHYNKRDIFNCNCIKYAENNLKFCSHLISALDYVFRYTSRQNRLRNVLEIWVTENISVILDRLEITKENCHDGELSDFIEGKFKILTDL